LHLPDGYDAMMRALCQEEKRIFSGFSVIIAERIAISKQICLTARAEAKRKNISPRRRTGKNKFLFVHIREVSM
jgi:hypothetical protein